MNLGDLKRRVTRLFGDEAGVQIYGSDLIDWANDAQLDIVRRTECLRGVLSTVSINEEENYGTSIIKAVRVTYNGVPLRRTTIEALDDYNSARDASPVVTGSPTHYYEWETGVSLYPTPNIDGAVIKIWYVKIPTSLGADTDIPEIPAHYHEDMIRYMLARAKELDEEDTKAAALMNEYESRLVQSRFDAQVLDSTPSVRLLPGDYGDY